MLDIRYRQHIVIVLSYSGFASHPAAKPSGFAKV